MCFSIKCEGNCLIPCESVISNSSPCGKRKTMEEWKMWEGFLVYCAVEIIENENGTEIIEDENGTELPT